MSARGLVPGLDAAHPLGELLPALYQDDDLGQRWTAALDTVLAPAVGALDSLAGYVDPELAPVDFLEWLAGWVGVVLDETWPVERQRRLVADAVELFSWHGTARGVAGLVRAYLGTEPELAEDGGTAWSPVPGGDLPGRRGGHLEVTVRVPDPSEVDQRRLEAIVHAAAPAHLTTSVKVRRGKAPAKARAAAVDPPAGDPEASPPGPPTPPAPGIVPQAPPPRQGRAASSKATPLPADAPDTGAPDGDGD